MLLLPLSPISCSLGIIFGSLGLISEMDSAFMGHTLRQEPHVMQTSESLLKGVETLRFTPLPENPMEPACTRSEHVLTQSPHRMHLLSLSVFNLNLVPFTPCFSASCSISTAPGARKQELQEDLPRFPDSVAVRQYLNPVRDRHRA